MDPHDALNVLNRPARNAAQSPAARLPHRWLIALTVLLGVALAAGGWWFAHPQPIHVTAASVTTEGGATEGGNTSVLNASGYVVAQMQTTVAAQVTGMVTDVYVREGDTVKKGQIIARLDDRTARTNAAGAAALMRSATAQSMAYRALAERDRQIRDRRRILVGLNAVSPETFEEAEANHRYNQALADSYAQTAEQYRQTLAYYRIIRDYSDIRAPFSGVVTERYAHPGEMISPQAVGGFTQTGICTIVDMTSLELDVDIGEALITRLKTGQRATIVLDAYPDWHIPAHVVVILPTANQQKATIKVRVGFDKPDTRILPQMGAQVWFEAGDTPQTAAPQRLFIPAAAVRRDENGTYVFVIAENVAHKIPVRIAPEKKNRLRVLSGLLGGERVVTSTKAPLEDGSKVQEP